MAVRLLSAGTLRQGHRKRCANGCGEPAVAYDKRCHKNLCWYHLVMEHPYEVDGENKKKHGETYKMYNYYGP
jgi:hypothetical protein